MTTALVPQRWTWGSMRGNPSLPELTNRLNVKLTELGGAVSYNASTYNPLGWIILTSPAYGLTSGGSAARNTAAFVAAHAAAIEGDTLYVPPGDYLMDPVTFTKSLNVLLAHGATITANSLTSELGLLTFQGTLTATATTLTSAVPQGSNILPVADTSAFPIGTVVQIKDTSLAATEFAYEEHYVVARSVASGAGALYLMSPTELPYTYPSGATGTVTVITPIFRATVEGGQFNGGGLGGTNVSLISFDYGWLCTVQTEVTNFRYTGIEFRHGKHNEAYRCLLGPSNADRSAATPPDAGYGISIRLSSSHLQVTHGIGRGLRHALILSEGAHTITFTGGDYTGCYAAAVTTHFRRALMVKFDGCLLSGDIFDSDTALNEPTASFGALGSTTDTRLIMSNLLIQQMRGAGIRFASGALQNTYLEVNGAIINECAPDSTASEGSVYFINLRHFNVSDIQVIRSDTVAFPCFRVQSCEDFSFTNCEGTFTTTQSGGGNIIFRVLDCKRGTFLGCGGTLDGTGTVFVLSATTLGDSDLITYVGCRSKATGGAADKSFSSNATNTGEIANTWNTGTTLNSLPGGLTALGNLLNVGADASTGPVIASVNGAAGAARDLRFRTAGVDRWIARANSTAESGSNAGSDFELLSRDDTGALIDTVWSIPRVAGGTAALNRPLRLASSATVTGSGGTHGETQIYDSLSESLTLNTGGLTTDSVANLLPAGAVIGSVTYRVLTSITTAANFSLGDATTPTRFAAALTTLTAANTGTAQDHLSGAVPSVAAGPVQGAASKLRITCNVNPGAGVIRVTVNYQKATPPTS